MDATTNLDATTNITMGATMGTTTTTTTMDGKRWRKRRKSKSRRRERRKGRRPEEVLQVPGIWTRSGPMSVEHGMVDREGRSLWVPRAGATRTRATEDTGELENKNKDRTKDEKQISSLGGGGGKG